jgi:type IV pilus assembly protein PilA
MLARIRKAQEEREAGFTLIELLVVIIIIGILAAIAIPVFLNQRKKGWDAQAKSDARNLATLEETYLSDNDYYVAKADATRNAADPFFTNVQGVLTDYKPSASVQAVTIKAYTTADAATNPPGGPSVTDAPTDTTGVAGYCISVKSNSTNWFTYDSLKGGLQPGSTSASGC